MIAYSWFGAVTNNLTSGKNPVSYAMTNKLVKHRGSISGLMVYYHCLFYSESVEYFVIQFEFTIIIDLIIIFASILLGWIQTLDIDYS